MNRLPPSEGIYFVVRLPTRWELISFRFDRYEEAGHPGFWEKHVTPILVAAWVPKLFPGLDAADLQMKARLLKSEIDEFYDGFPRGRVARVETINRFSIYHGNNLKPGMRIKPRAIEQAFGIQGTATWKFDEHEQCTIWSAGGLSLALSLSEKWGTVSADFY